MTNPDTQQLQTAARYLLFFAGTWLATHGYIPNADVNDLVSAILIIVPPVWAFVSNELAKRQAVKEQVKAIQSGINLTVSRAAIDDNGNVITHLDPDATPPKQVTTKTAPEIVANFAPKAA